MLEDVLLYRIKNVLFRGKSILKKALFADIVVFGQKIRPSVSRSLRFLLPNFVRKIS